MKNIIKGLGLYLFAESKQYQKDRLIVCNDCNGGKMTCPICNCFVELKTRVKEESCPIGKWQ